MGSLLGYLTTGGNRRLHEIGTAVSHPQVLLLPLGVPLSACPTQSLSEVCGVRGVLTTANVGNVTQCRRFQITKCYPSGRRSMSRHFATCFRDSPPMQCAFRGGGSHCKPPHPSQRGTVAKSCIV